MPFKEATSVTLSSERLGLIGQADVIQGDGDGVVPVDVKRGSPARCAERVWPPERVQLAAVGLLLSDNGYRCDRGAIFFVETRERVWVEFDDDLVKTTLDALRALRSPRRRAHLQIHWTEAPSATGAPWQGSACRTKP